ncbi:copper amine oxidase N-terminal domain-containing protein [Paenibacillus cymbidii]|uniref:copper amine oxidase N-terminal domain-containing protein n=1 Tax=Paenibacillus cymbidii TaxID=1639034 RepID=UPI00108110EA|nr:copper amine oxidase N-terminal domain-containing protein [Paenibacillus cymbidii]
MKKRKKWLIAVLAAASMLVGGVVWAEGRYSTIEVFFDRINIAVNGQSAALSKDSIIYEGSVYVPLRSLSELLGAKVNWDTSSRTVDIDFLGNRTDVLYGASRKPFYQYIAVENNRIMSDMLDAMQRSDMDKLKQQVEQIGKLRDIAQNIGDPEAYTLLDKLAAATELMRSAYTSGKMDDYGIAWVIFRDSQSRLLTLLSTKLNAAQ